jgi:hypothetical protein
LLCLAQVWGNTDALKSLILFYVLVIVSAFEARKEVEEGSDLLGRHGETR